jgi:hypothetical protein
MTDFSAELIKSHFEKDEIKKTEIEQKLESEISK